MSALDEAEAASAAFKGKIANVGERLGEATGAYIASAALGGAMAGSLRGKSVVVSVVDAAGATKSVKAEVRAEQNGVLRLVAAGGAVFNCGAAHVHEPGDDAAAAADPAAADPLAELAFADVIASADRLGYPCLAGIRIAATGDLKKGDPVLVWTPGILGQLRPGVVVQGDLAVEVEAVGPAGDGGDDGGDDDDGGGGAALAPPASEQALCEPSGHGSQALREPAVEGAGTAGEGDEGGAPAVVRAPVVREQPAVRVRFAWTNEEEVVELSRLGLRSADADALDFTGGAFVLAHVPLEHNADASWRVRVVVPGAPDDQFVYVMGQGTMTKIPKVGAGLCHPARRRHGDRDRLRDQVAAARAG